MAEQIPNDAIIILQLEGDEAFNTWARRLAESHQGEGYPLIVVKIKKLRPLRSRISQLELEQPLSLKRYSRASRMPQVTGSPVLILSNVLHGQGEL